MLHDFSEARVFDTGLSAPRSVRSPISLTRSPYLCVFLHSEPLPVPVAWGSCTLPLRHWRYDRASGRFNQSSRCLLLDCPGCLVSKRRPRIVGVPGLGILDSLVHSRGSQTETADLDWAQGQRTPKRQIAKFRASAYRHREAAQTDTEVPEAATTILPLATTSTPVAVDPITVAAMVDLALGGCAAVIGDGSYAMEIIGEAQYQSELEFVAGPRTADGAQCFSVALLMPEPTNLRDRNAVSVRLRTGVVGYLRRDMAPVFLRNLRHGGFAMAVSGAVIVGGWDRGASDREHFRVQLDAFPPFQLEQP